MIRFLEAGLIAGTRQLLAVILITSVAFLAGSEKDVIESASGFVRWRETEPSIPALLTWAYLLTAIGLALTHNYRFVLTTKRIRYATRLLVRSTHLRR